MLFCLAPNRQHYAGEGVTSPSGVCGFVRCCTVVTHTTSFWQYCGLRPCARCWVQRFSAAPASYATRTHSARHIKLQYYSQLSIALVHD